MSSKKKSLVLMYPNMRWQKEDMVTLWNLEPVTLCLLAQMVRDLVDVHIVDAQFEDMSIDQFKAVIKAIEPDVVGISLLTSEYAQVLDITASAVKGISNKTTVVAGGVHPTTMPEFVMRNDDIDYCVIGEGEYVLRELLLWLDNKGPVPQKGLGYRKSGEVVLQERALVQDLKKLPWPAYELIDYQKYLNKSQRNFTSNNPPALPFVRMITTRGCPFGCLFCQVEHIAGKSVRTRDPEDVVEEMLFLKDKYNIRSIIFDDDNLLMGSNHYAKKMFKLMIQRNVDLKWIGISFALFLMTDELLDLMKASGCVGVNIAIESGNKRVLKEIVGKPIKDLDQVPAQIGKIKQRGMYCIANFIIGFPGETWDEIRETITFAENCGADYVKIYNAVPLYKTKLFNLARQHNALELDEAYPIADWRYGQIKSDEWTSKDISILRAYEWDRINFKPEKMDRLQEITGATITDLNRMRKETRDNLSFR